MLLLVVFLITSQKYFLVQVDSMLLDKGHNIMYLSHAIPGMNALESLFAFIWNLVHGRDITDGSEEVFK